MNPDNPNIPIVWIGTDEEYNQLIKDDPNKLYIIRNQNNIPVLIQYIDRETKLIFATITQYSGNPLSLPTDKEYSNIYRWEYEFYRNFKCSNNDPLPTVAPQDNVSYYADCIFIEVSKSPAETSLSSSGQSRISFLYVYSDENIYFKIKEDNYTYAITYQTEILSNRKVYKCTITINNMSYIPGTTYTLTPEIEFYTDQYFNNKLGSSPFNLKVYHESGGDSD